MSLHFLINTLFNALNLLLFVRVILSWVPNLPYHPIVESIYKVTDPLLKPFQNLFPANKLGIDFSPILAFMTLSLIRKILFMIF